MREKKKKQPRNSLFFLFTLGVTLGLVLQAFRAPARQQQQKGSTPASLTNEVTASTNAPAWSK